MPAQPEISVDALTPNHPSPQWRHLVTAALPGSLVAPLAACRSEHRAEIVAEALRRMAIIDPSFAQRVLDATLAERRDNHSPVIGEGTWVLWYGRLLRTLNVSQFAEENLVPVVDPWFWDARAAGMTFESDVAPIHELRVLTDEEGERRRAERDARGY